MNEFLINPARTQIINQTQNHAPIISSYADQITLQFADDTISEYNTPHFIQIYTDFVRITDKYSSQNSIYFNSTLKGVWYKDC